MDNELGWAREREGKLMVTTMQKGISIIYMLFKIGTYPILGLYDKNSSLTFVGFDGQAKPPCRRLNWQPYFSSNVFNGLPLLLIP